MQKQIIDKRIKELTGDISRLSDTLNDINQIEILQNSNNYKTLLTEAVLRWEKTACQLRHLVYANMTISKKDYLKSTSVMQDISIKHENEILEIMLPCLIPKRKQHQSREFLIDPLFNALEDYTINNPLSKFTHCVLCFTHIYNRELSRKRVRDHDNLDSKQLFDIITLFTMSDDGDALCDLYNTTELGEADCTRGHQ